MMIMGYDRREAAEGGGLWEYPRSAKKKRESNGKSTIWLM